MDFVYRFPVVKGVQATREYYIAMIPLKMIPKLFTQDEEYVPPEHRAQRKLNESRIPVISKCTGSCIVLYSIIILKTTRNVISLIVSCVKWWR